MTADCWCAARPSWWLRRYTRRSWQCGICGRKWRTRLQNGIDGQKWVWLPEEEAERF